MPDRANQHFVPQYYFRLFTRGSRQVSLLMRDSGCIHVNASIKGQCAKRRFYGSEEVENAFGKLETAHSIAIRALLESVDLRDLGRLKRDERAAILQAVVFQRARTELEYTKQAPATQSLMVEFIKEHLKCKKDIPGRAEMLAALEDGTITIKVDPVRRVLMQISVALEQTALLSDMRMCIIRNYTRSPFVFSDSPVVFYNTYYKSVTDRGVLGLQTPGLQVFLPLTSYCQMMLYDPSVYGGRCREPIYFVQSQDDVDQLNALQLHHSLQAIYFASPSAKGYVKALWEKHKNNLEPPRARFRQIPIEWVRGINSGTVYHTYEPQLNHDLNLSIVECRSESVYKPRHRSPEIVREVENMRKKTKRVGTQRPAKKKKVKPPLVERSERLGELGPCSRRLFVP